MSGNQAVLIELLLIVAVVFGFGIQQLRSLRRDREESKPTPPKDADGSGSDGPA